MSHACEFLEYGVLVEINRAWKDDLPTKAPPTHPSAPTARDQLDLQLQLDLYGDVGMDGWLIQAALACPGKVKEE
ncbi:hypothetical protein TSOC_001170 [Tetrabaena socialis]|uniref:Uncharacterized protein n=1 Tax=Tetrabaena socialis TaxID=47790 RepID=A0A2J8AHD3_9CHLO|nr:hypothetical protein TSOC_001170 [Tetrabaena socialis]|eukprot:PNH11933.1 hypothetical protein TSOC_001170 [Tetrabaena socialis]